METLHMHAAFKGPSVLGMSPKQAVGAARQDPSRAEIVHVASHTVCSRERAQGSVLLE